MELDADHDGKVDECDFLFRNVYIPAFIKACQNCRIGIDT